MLQNIWKFKKLFVSLQPRKYAKIVTILPNFMKISGVESFISHVETKHKKGLKAFKEEHPDCRLILVSLDPITRKSGDKELVYVLDFLKMLWSGEIF